jgi:sugar phosphate permease
LLAGVFGSWSIAQAVAGFVASFWQFSIARVVRDWYNVRGRGLPTGIWNCSSSLGPAIPFAFGVVGISGGWIADWLMRLGFSPMNSRKVPVIVGAGLRRGAGELHRLGWGAIQNFGGYLGGALAPTVTGFIVQATGSFVPELLVGASIGLVSALMYRWSSAASRSQPRNWTPWWA